ncbi:MAG: hypothetical protein H7062_23345, partial [Candidatus Saccharimonas sp.]|nr:hypothetical protein [Planctomycetaceae bacterium]
LVRTASALQEAQTDRALPAKLRILLASDLPAGANLDALRGFEWPGDLRVEPLVARASSPSNAGLQLVERNLDLGDDLLRVRVTNSADARKESFSLRWEGADAAAVPVYVPPGQSRVIVPPKRTDGAASTALILTGDDHDFDNKVHVAQARTETKLVVYCGTDKPDDPEGLRFYLEGVFAASRRYRIEMTGWRDTLSTTKTERPSLVVLVEPEADAGAFVTSHLAQGGAVLIAARSPNNGTASLKQCGLDEVSLTEAVVRRDAMLGDIDFEHSLFAPFAESQFSDFTGIRFWKHRTLVTGLKTEDGQAGSLPHGGRTLARFDDGAPAFVEFPSGKGRVWLMTAGWHPADSQLARSSKFPPLMFRMLEQASGAVSRPESVPVGSSIPWPKSSGEAASHGTVRLPDGRAVTDLPLDSAFAETGQPGLYGLEVEGRSDTVAVNLAADESRTAPLPIEQLESLGVRFGTAERPEDVRRAKDRERQLQLVELEQNQKLWRWGLLAVIGLLLIETWLAGRTGSPIEPSS